MVLRKDSIKLVFLSVLTLVVVAFFLGYFFYTFSEKLRQSKKEESRELIDVGVGVIKYFHKLEMSGEITTKEAQRYARKSLESAVFGESGYFWIHKPDGTMLMLPYFPKLVGTNFYNKKDSNGLYFNREITKVAKEGGGVVEYYWENPKTKMKTIKASYSRYFEPWDWVIGTGIFFDEMNAKIVKTIYSSLWLAVFGFINFVIFVIIAGRFYSIRLNKFISLDSLTGLYSKRSLKKRVDYIDKADKSNELFVSMFIDLDKFKDINKKYGHSGGDEILINIANIIKKVTRDSDYCIRYGGDEFVLISTFNNEGAVLKAAERIRVAISDMIIGGFLKDIKVTASIGVAIYNATDESFNNTIVRSDKKLYESKSAGGNKVSI